MEKLPEKWCIKNDHQEVRDWLADMYCKEVKNWTHYEYIGFHGGDSHNGCLGAPLAYHTRNGSTEITFDQFKRLVLGETEEWKPKVGDWVKIINTGFNVSGNRLHEVKKIAEFNIRNSMWYVVFENGSKGHGTYYENAGDYLLKCLCPARPEEIPQEEVEFVECVGNKGKSTCLLCSDLLIGKIYSTKDKTPWRSLGSWNEVLGDSCYGKNFRPSTREAYEAQQEAVVNITMDGKVIGRMKNIKQEVNKCSTINTNQNEYKNEKVILRRKTYTVPRGKRKTGSKVQAKRLLSPSKSRS